MTSWSRIKPLCGARVNRAVKNAEEPGPDWETYDVRILKSSDQYFEARQQLNKSLSCHTSDLQTEEEEEDVRPKRKPKAIHFLGDSDDSEDEHPRKKSRSQSKTSIQPPAPAIPPPPSPAVEPPPCQQQTFSASQVHTPAWRGRRFDSGTLPCSATEAQILDLLEHLKKQMEQLEAKVNYLTSKLDATPQEMEVQIPVQLPLTSVEEVNTFENWLKDAAHSQLKQKLISSLAAIGGHDTKCITWNILAHIFHDDVGKQINWKGVNGKTSFNQMASKTLLLHSVRKNSISCASTDHDICKHAIRWFNLAADRDSSRRRSGTQEVQPSIHLFNKNYSLVTQFINTVCVTIVILCLHM
nr:uncharacterized protein LOC129155652 [Nothobranchius furzeri]